MLTKSVDGAKIAMSEEEENATRAEWALNDPSLKTEPPKSTAADAIINNPDALAALKAALAKA